MIEAKKLIQELKKININFFTGVPDSLLSEFSKSLHFDFKDENHIISTNEGSALATNQESSRISCSNWPPYQPA